MVKKMIVLLLLAALLLPASALAQQVVDAAGVLDADGILAITQAVDAIEQEHQIDLVVLITRQAPLIPSYSDDHSRVQAYADDFFDDGGYGMGKDFSGMLYMIDLNNRIQCISCCGVMMQYISDSREEAIFDAAQPYLSRNNLGRAALAAVYQTGEFMDRGRERGVFLYDEVTGERLTGMYNPLEMYEILLALGGGGLTVAIFAGSITGAYGLKGSTYHYDVNSKSTCNLTRDDEQFLRESVSRVARASSGGGHGSGFSGGGRSGGSGVRISSSGRMHSGGSRRF